MTSLICIDPGHTWSASTGGDPGACNGEYKESVAALGVAKILGRELNLRGFDTVFTRTSGRPRLTLKQRCNISNYHGADAFVSIHLNAAENKSAHGVEVLRYSKCGWFTQSLATQVLQRLGEATGFRNRGVKLRDNLYVLKHTIAPAILCEIGFISNDEECKQLFDSSVQEKVAKSIAEGISYCFKGA